MEHAHSYQEALKTAGYSAALSGGLSLILSVYKKHMEGKSLEEYDEDDWCAIGLDTAKATVRGGVSGAAIYGLTNCLGFSAPLAVNCVSAVAGIGELYIGFQKLNFSVADSPLAANIYQLWKLARFSNGR